MQKKHLCSLIAATFLISYSFIGFAGDANTDKAAELLKARDYKGAYALLEPLESEKAGNVDYDYLFGVSAVETGEATRAIFAFERVLAVQPNNADARAMLARAYFLAGEPENAKAEFKNIQSDKLDPAISKLVKANILAIDKATGQASTFAAYIDLGLGYDTNINSATSNGSVVIGGIPLTLSNSSIEKGSAYGALSGGVSFKAPVAKDFTVFGGLQASTRTNWTDGTFDPSYTDVSLGASYKKYIDTFTASINRNDFNVNSNKFLESTGATAQWQREIDDANQVSVFGQYANLSYSGQSLRDAHRKVAGAGWGHAFSGDKAPVIFLSAYGGQEQATNSAFDYLASTNLYGVRAGGQFAVNYKTVAYATSSYENRTYDGIDPAFLTERNDKQYDFSVGVRYTPFPGLTVKPQFSYLNNDSNISLFGYERTVLSINLRKDFNW
ncbi:MAG: tetratricopeptide repeat protein [Methylophilaceae bacterium]|nr:tetratricopeptide repeat protein [Methyloradius sp.]